MPICKSPRSAKSTGKSISQFIRFAIIGVLGFFVDSAILYSLLACNVGYILARLVSFLFAVQATWFLNRRFTFALPSNIPASRLWLKYLAAMSAGGLLNVGTYTLVMNSFPYHIALPALGIAAGSLVGMMANFTVAKIWVFSHTK